MRAVLRKVKAPFVYLRSIGARYGAAWLVTSQFFSWLHFFMIYAYLLLTDTDVGALVRSWDMGETVITIADNGGRFALALVLNKMLSPLRFFLNLAVAPIVAPWVNPKVDACVKWFKRKSGDKSSAASGLTYAKSV
ncbi:hypothetical protein BC832DRAFT_529753 [Gaertneriomyces semiglobifer]|nr:hypothetical protein BC832DRAFT_529753 [Gaertneriomyces semiglobifer]